MEKSLISKVVLAIVLVSVSTQAFAMDLGRSKIKQWVKNNPVVKDALISGVSIITVLVAKPLNN